MIREIAELNRQADLLDGVQLQAHPSLLPIERIEKARTFWPFIRAALMLLRRWPRPKWQHGIDEFVTFMDLMF